MKDFTEFLKVKFAGKKLAVVGYGVEGKSTVTWLQKVGLDFVVCDQGSPEPIPGVEFYLGEDWQKPWPKVDLLLRSPGIHPFKAGMDEFWKEGKVFCQTDLLLEFLPENSIGVTGTFGKGSTVALIEAICKEANHPYLLGGNFGIPAWDLMDGYLGQTLLLELSSFQLYGNYVSPKRAAILQTTSEHLDWHSDTQDYRMAKANLVCYQKSEDKTFYWDFSEGSKEIALTSPGQKLALDSEESKIQLKGESLSFGGHVLHYAQCKIFGKHQMENMAMAAAMALDLGLGSESIAKALKEFPGLPLRTENLGTFHNITFVNDSYATRPEASLGAAKSIEENFVLLLGGSEKFADFSELCHSLSKMKNLKSIQLMGQTADRLFELLRTAGFNGELNKVASLDEALENGVRFLGDYTGTILLSPACASFGMFKNYKHRGEEFTKWVKNWKEKSWN